MRESKDRVDVFQGPRRVATHARAPDLTDARVTSPEHRPPRHEGVLARNTVSSEHKQIVDRLPESADYVALLQRRGRGSARNLRWLLRMVKEYPREPMRDALLEALRYGMTDLERLERMVLRRIGRELLFPEDDDHDR